VTGWSAQHKRAYELMLANCRMLEELLAR